MKPYSQSLIDRLNAPKHKGIEISPCAKSEVLHKMKPKIPKSGKSIYKGFYIRPLEKTELIYHIESGLFVAAMNGTDARVWIIRNQEEIDRRIKEVLDVEV